jgi:hypothetical protein
MASSLGWLASEGNALNSLKDANNMQTHLSCCVIIVP